MCSEEYWYPHHHVLNHHVLHKIVSSTTTHTHPPHPTPTPPLSAHIPTVSIAPGIACSHSATTACTLCIAPAIDRSCHAQWSPLPSNGCANVDNATSSGCRTTCTKHARGIMMAMLPMCHAFASILSTIRVTVGRFEGGTVARRVSTYCWTMDLSWFCNAGNCMGGPGGVSDRV